MVGCRYRTACVRVLLRPIIGKYQVQLVMLSIQRVFTASMLENTLQISGLKFRDLRGSIGYKGEEDGHCSICTLQANSRLIPYVFNVELNF